ncbi:MAG: elongation factor G, partial [Dehalococcoidia bacterium]
VTRVDREHANFDGVLAALRARYGSRVAPIAIPDGAGGVTRLIGAAGAAIDGARGEAFAVAREMLIEAVAEADDDLLAHYLDGDEIGDEELAAALCEAVRTGRVAPVAPVCAPQALGVAELLADICDLAPGPIGRAYAQDEGDALDIAAEGPALVQVFKTASDPFVGHLSYVKVLRGRLTHGDHLRNHRSQSEERAAHLFLMRGKEQIEVPELLAGDIGAIPKLTHTATGDVLTANGREPAAVLPLAFPAPTYRSALHPKSRDDVDRVSTALARILEQDPTIGIEREAGTGEFVLLTLGDVHATIVASRLQREYGVAVDVTEPLVPYCETIRGSVQTEHRHKKQTGGRGQFGHVVLKVEPLDRGAGFEFVDRVTGGHIPRQFIPAVEHGVVEALEHGPLTGSRLVDLRVTLLDGSSHSVDSSEFAFKIAAAQALHQAVMEAQPVLLEPVMRLRIDIPSDLVGDISGEVSGRRGNVLGFEPGEETTVVEALAPLAEVQRLAPQLRSLTHGRGRFTLTFDHLADVPPQVQEKVLAERGAK